MAATHKKVAVEVEALELTATTTLGDIFDFCGDDLSVYVWDRTIEATMKAGIGSVLVKGVGGEIHPCGKAMFDATHTRLEKE